MQWRQFDDNEGVLRRRPRAALARRGCCHCERPSKQWFRLAIKGDLLPISGKTEVDLIPM